MLVQIKVQKITMGDSTNEDKAVSALVTLFDKNASFNIEYSKSNSSNRTKMTPSHPNGRLPEISNHVKEYVQNMLKAYLSALMSDNEILIRVDNSEQDLPELEDEII